MIAIHDASSVPNAGSAGDLAQCKLLFLSTVSQITRRLVERMGTSDKCLTETGGIASRLLSNLPGILACWIGAGCAGVLRER